MKPLLLCIMDGVGIKDREYGNAFRQANTPNFDYLLNTYPNCKIDASGKSVGLPAGQMGNSEVGHMNIGAGRIVYQALEFINNAIEEETFYQNEGILEVMNHAKSNNSKLHLVGLISDGGVHSHINHLLALLEMCKKNNLEKVYLHLFTDGRDVEPTSAYSYIEKVENKINELGIGIIATIGGRYYGMDRDNNYDRLIKAYDVIVNEKGPQKENIKEFIEESYKEGITDEFLVPTMFTTGGNIEENDAVIAFNFRKDRLKEMFTALTNPEFNDMEVTRFNNLKVITMMPVVESVKAPSAFKDPSLKNILGEYLEKNGLSQLRIAETEKYAHVTFFFDGGKEEDYQNEKKILIPSPKVATYDLKPEMSCYEVTEALLPEIENYDVIILNFANGDMVGHTGIYDAIVKAVKTIDSLVKEVVDCAKENGYSVLITADHGNADNAVNADGSPNTAHSLNPVPFIVVDNDIKEVKDGILADIAPTVLKMMGIEQPAAMTGTPLV